MANALTATCSLACRTWHVFSDLLPALQHGEVADMRVPRISDTIYNAADGSAAEGFARGMASINSAAFHALAQALDFAKHRTIVDIGGSIGEFSCVLAAAHPHLLCTTCDLPTVAPHAARNIARRGLQQRVKAAEVDFLRDAFPAADVITMSMVRQPRSLLRLPADTHAKVISCSTLGERCLVRVTTCVYGAGAAQLEHRAQAAADPEGLRSAAAGRHVSGDQQHCRQ